LPDAEVSETLPPAPAPSFPTDKLPARVRKQMVFTAAYAWTDLAACLPQFAIQYGYRQATLARTLQFSLDSFSSRLFLFPGLGRRRLRAAGSARRLSGSATCGISAGL